MERWQGKTAVVTGAGSGIGAAITEALLDAGLQVVGLDVHIDFLTKLRSEGKTSIHPKVCDVTSSEDVSEAFKWIEETLHGTHVLVNNAGVLYDGHITDIGTNPLSEAALLRTVDTLVKGMLLCTRHAVTSMKRNCFDGHIFNINSIASHYIPSKPSLNVYPAAKHASLAFTESLINELACFHSHIKTTSISPGVVNTGMAASVPEWPMLQPRDIAQALLYALATPPNVNVTQLTLMSTSEKKL